MKSRALVTVFLSIVCVWSQSLFADGSFDNDVKVVYFNPSFRTYIDNGSDDDGELDAYSNGQIEPIVSAAAIELNPSWANPWKSGLLIFHGGISIGKGKRVSTIGSDDNVTFVMLDAAVALMSRSSTNPIRLEMGYAFSVAAEHRGDDTDGAWFVGIGFDLEKLYAKPTPK